MTAETDQAERGQDLLAGSGRRAYLDEVVADLWSRRGAQPRDVSAYLMLPSGRTPTLLVPRRPRRVAATMIRSYKSSADPATRLKLGALAVAARVGLTDLLPFRTPVATAWDAGETVAEPDDLDILGYLQRVLGIPVLAALYTSPARANRKPVLHLVTPDGASYGFVKIAVNPLTGDLVRHEAQALLEVGASRLDHLVLPRLLHHGRWRGRAILVQTAIGRGRGGARPGDQLQTAMRELSELRGGWREQLATSSYVHRLAARLDALPPGPAAGGLAAALQELRSSPRAREGQLRLGSWHGDWTPWNMAAVGSRVALWDWERFETGVPVGFDALHYDIQRQIVGVRRDPLDAARSLVAGAGERLRCFGVRGDEAQRVAALYLLEIGARYLHDGLLEAGGRLGDVGSWLVPTVSDAVRRLSAEAVDDRR